MPSFFVTCAKNLETLLKDEISHIALEGKIQAQLKETVAGVSVEGPLALGYRICLWSRLANHVFLPLLTFEAKNPEELYGNVQTIHWKDHLSVEGTLWIDVTGSHARFNHPHFVAQKIKDAIVDQLRTPDGKRPSIQENRPDLVLNMHMDKGLCTLSVSLSGESLHKRGYRLEGGKAPLKETLAAALLLRAGWVNFLHSDQKNHVFLDPMCGTGTLIIEAALMAFDIAPGLGRSYFGFLNWPRHEKASWEKLLKEASDRKLNGLAKKDLYFFGSDIHPHAISKSLENIERAKLSDRISVYFQDCGELSLPQSEKFTEPGFIICNPPYGERMDSEEVDGLRGLFQKFGLALKKNFLGWKLGIFSGAPKECSQAIKIRSKKQYAFFNGTLPCQLFLYEVSE